MASSGKDDNSSQFFFTLNRADELNGKHTLFGKVRERGRERNRERERESERERCWYALHDIPMCPFRLLAQLFTT